MTRTAKVTVLLGALVALAAAYSLPSARTARATPPPAAAAQADDGADALVGDAAWAALEQAAWVAEGAQAPERVVYVFVDPQCPYCNLLWRASLPYLGAGLQVRNVVVAYLSDKSGPQAEAILGAEDPAHAHAEHQRRFKEGGIAPAAQTDPGARRSLAANNALFSRLGIPATPAIYYRDAQGRVQRVIGLPELSMLATDVFRLPELPQTDPGLAHYQ